MSDPTELVFADLGHLETEDVRGVATFEARRAGLVHGVGLWFVAELYAGIGLTNAPPNSVPS